MSRGSASQRLFDSVDQLITVVDQFPERACSRVNVLSDAELPEANACESASRVSVANVPTLEFSWVYTVASSLVEFKAADGCANAAVMTVPSDV